MIEYIKGDLFETDCDIIAHQVNCMGVMEHGVAFQVRDKFPDVYNNYRIYCRQNKNLLGTIFICPSLYENGKIIVNMFAQETYGKGLHTDYVSLFKCLGLLHDLAEEQKVSVALPYKVGCGLAGGDWSIVQPMVEDVFSDNILCKVYKLDKGEKYEDIYGSNGV